LGSGVTCGRCQRGSQRLDVAMLFAPGRSHTHACGTWRPSATSYSWTRVSPGSRTIVCGSRSRRSCTRPARRCGCTARTRRPRRVGRDEVAPWSVDRVLAVPGSLHGSRGNGLRERAELMQLRLRTSGNICLMPVGHLTLLPVVCPVAASPAGAKIAAIVYAVVDDALSPDLPLGADRSILRARCPSTVSMTQLATTSASWNTLR
jgi:hypothetical protein